MRNWRRMHHDILDFPLRYQEHFLLHYHTNIRFLPNFTFQEMRPFLVLITVCALIRNREQCVWLYLFNNYSQLVFFHMMGWVGMYFLHDGVGGDVFFTWWGGWGCIFYMMGWVGMYFLRHGVGGDAREPIGILAITKTQSLFLVLLGLCYVSCIHGI